MDKDDLPDEIKDMLKKGNIASGIIKISSDSCNCEACKSKTVPAHYGVKEETFDLWVKGMLCDMIMSSNKSQVLDKWFTKKNELQDIRAKVLAYSAASDYFAQLEFDE